MPKTIYNIMYYEEINTKDRGFVREYDTWAFDNIDDLTDWIEYMNKYCSGVNIYDIQREEVEN